MVAALLASPSSAAPTARARAASPGATTPLIEATRRERQRVESAAVRRVMISYSSEREELARRLHHLLGVRGHAPRLDRLDLHPGERFRRTLAWWLSHCQAAVILLDERALTSPWVRYELSVLVTRQLVENDVRLLLLYLDGLTPRDVKDRLDLDPLALAEIQSVEVSETMVDIDLDAILDATFATAPEEVVLDRHVGRVADVLRNLGPATTADARRLIGERLGDDRDPWFDDPELADQADGGTALRWALARELTSVTLPDAYPGLQRVAQDPNHLLGYAYSLIDLNLMTTFDTVMIGRLDAARPGHCVILALTTTMLAEIAARAVENRCGFETFPVVIPDTLGATTPEGNARWIVNGLLEASRGVLPVDDPDGPAAAIAELAADGHRVFAVLLRPEGITREIIQLALAQAPPGVAFVVLASRERSPALWQSRLGTIEVVGLDLPDPVWASFVATEDMLVSERDRRRKNLRRVHEHHHP